MTLLKFQELLLDLGVSCRIRCIGANGWTVSFSWESGAEVIATGLDLEAAARNAVLAARGARPLTDQELAQLERTLAKVGS